MARVVYIGAPEADAQLFEQRARADFPGIDLYATNERGAAATHLGGCEVLIGHHFQFDEPLLAQAGSLRWIQSLTSGTDAILKLASLAPDVAVTSTRGMHGPQMSELVFLSMLALTRDYPRMLRNQQAATWERWPQPLLSGKTVVIVGVGAISACLAPCCRAFGMRVVGVSASPRAVEGFDRIYPRSELRAAAAEADYLVLVVPHSPETDNLVDESVIRALPPRAYVVNVARGGVLDEQALLAALRGHRIAGAHLDVFRQTPLPPDSPLWRQEGLLVTPNIGGMSNVYLDQCYPIVRENLAHYLGGRAGQLVNRVPR
jgi:phosphoglycerate dehydrogenase-like enzyme